MFEKIAYYYKKGIYKASHLRVFAEKNIITQSEYNDIIGQTEA